jgi:glutamine amidotransferase
VIQSRGYRLCPIDNSRYYEGVPIYVLDCGIGNVGAVRSMYRRLGLDAELIDAPRRLAPGDMLVLPGIGSFDVGARALKQRGVVEFIHDAIAEGHPLLGICLGMQLLCRGSEEGNLPGLGLIPADVVRLDPGPERVRIPHMGWNIAEPVRDNPLLPMGSQQQRFYFTHSFRVRCDSEDHVWATTDYGTVFPSSIGAGNVMGVQFHPEKSHRFGKALLERFAILQMADA